MTDKDYGGDYEALHRGGDSKTDISKTIFKIINELNVSRGFDVNLKERVEDLMNLLIVFVGTLIMMVGLILLVIMTQAPPILVVSVTILISVGLLFVIVGVTRFSIPLVVFVRTKEELLHMLSPSEKKIIDTLIEAQDVLSQSEIAERTGFSQAKVSRLVRRLENRRIIVRFREDKKKLVKLREEFLQLLGGAERR